LGNLANGGTATITYRVSAVSEGEAVTNTAGLTAQQFIDPDSANDTAAAVLTIDPGGGCSLIR
jgi:hypothetical protein